jgi:hypothetical protein
MLSFTRWVQHLRWPVHRHLRRLGDPPDFFLHLGQPGMRVGADSARL